jgi:hypothetical protein
VIGRLIVCPRQIDMVLFSDAIMDWYIEQFMMGKASPAQGGTA